MIYVDIIWTPGHGHTGRKGKQKQTPLQQTQTSKANAA